MDEKILETEKFDTLKELADVQQNISLGRAELKKLEETTEEYMVVREKEAEERVIEVLNKSRNALEETTNNQKELKSYNSELQAYANELKFLATDITTLFQDFNKRTDEADSQIEKQLKELNEVSKLLKLERIQIAEDKKSIKRQKTDLLYEWRLLKDRQQTLKKGFEELKTKKVK